MSKTRLYIDVDDTIIAGVHLGSGFDLRPSVMTQLRFLSRLFDCWWLTCWSEKNIRELVDQLYGGKINQDMKYANWGFGHPLRKAGFVLDPSQPQDFYWLEDPLCKEEVAALEAAGKLDRFIPVEPHGQWGFTLACQELFKRSGISDADLAAVKAKREWFELPKEIPVRSIPTIWHESLDSDVNVLAP